MIKLRYVKCNEHYTIQKKTLIGWRYIKKTSQSGPIAYTNKDSHELLADIFDYHFKKPAHVIEYEMHPTIHKFIPHARANR